MKKAKKTQSKSSTPKRPSTPVKTGGGISANGKVEQKPISFFKNGITNLADVAKPFKNPEYNSRKRPKPLKQIIATERVLEWPVDFPTYWNIDAPPSLQPQKKYCDITGLEAPYTDPKTNLRYHSAEVYATIKQLPPGAEQSYLALRNANVVLR
ncbi:Co-chaperone [Spiromyces aspiralis]|uniref:Co-chaperone n=1 Tax=Spiromyces aspiralis TaxID=68401 RepID=A0ACC1HGN3_9FUNG|nr:Co-chaperone [Spiromyces aspiralis]